jgi:hypothetical protein
MKDLEHELTRPLRLQQLTCSEATSNCDELVDC